MAQVRIPTQLRSATDGKSEVEANGDTVGGIIGELGDRYPGVLPRLLDESGNLRRFVNLYVDDENVRFMQGLDTPVPAGARVTIIPAIAGG